MISHGHNGTPTTACPPGPLVEQELSNRAPAGSNSPRFDFERDTFAFPNELKCEYHIDPATGAMGMTKRLPPPSYALHCFVLVRSARQFLYHARFEPAQPKVSAEQYVSLICQVIKKSPRRPSSPQQKVVIPGFSCLREFSQVHESLLKANLGGAWQSYVLRSHWRMVFPVSRRHQQRTAPRLAKEIARGHAPIAHLVRFPQLTINHGLLLFGSDKDDNEIRFSGYDPNLPQAPIILTYDSSKRTFSFPPNIYWAGGRVDVIEIYRGWLY